MNYIKLNLNFKLNWNLKYMKYWELLIYKYRFILIDNLYFRDRLYLDYIRYNQDIKEILEEIFLM